MKYFFLFTIIFSCSAVFGQSKIPYPKPIVIDLSEPEMAMPKGLDKDAKKKWKELKRQAKLKEKATDKLFSFKLDSLQSSIAKDYVPIKTDKFQFDSLSNFGLKKSLKDSLLAVSSIYKQGKIQKLKQKYNVPDSVLGFSTYPSNDGLSIQEQIGLGNPNFNMREFSISKDSLGQVNYNDYLTEVPLDSSQMESLEYQKYLNEVNQLNDSLSSVDYTTLASSIASKRIENQLTSGDYLSKLSLPSSSPDPEKSLASYEEMINSDQYKRIMEDMPGKKAEIEKAIDAKDVKLDSLPIKPNFFLGQEKKLLGAQKQLAIIKKKRSFGDFLRSFVNQDMESLEEKTFTQKFSLSGHIQIGGRSPLLIDYSPAIAYQFTGKSSLGIGASGRVKIGNGSTDETDLLAYRAFFDYKLIGNIFIHTEWENTGLKELNPMTDVDERVWSSRWLVGLGKDFNFSRNVKGNILILYNFNSNADAPHSQRIQVRYGFKL